MTGPGATTTDAPSTLLAGLAHTIAELTQQLDAGGLGTLTDTDLLAFTREFERLRNRLAVVDHHVTGELDRRDLAHRLCRSKTKHLLADTLRIPLFEAHRRVTAAHHCGPRTSPLGEPLEPIRPQLAGLVATGDIGAHQLHQALGCLDKLSRLTWLTPAEIDSAETTLSEAAVVHGAREFDLIVQKVLDVIDPDGALPEERQREQLRQLILWKGADGQYRIKGRLTTALAHKLQTVLQPYLHPDQTTTDEISTDGTSADETNSDGTSADET